VQEDKHKIQDECRMRDINHLFEFSGVVVTSHCRIAKEKDRKFGWAFGGIELVAHVGNCLEKWVDIIERSRPLCRLRESKRSGRNTLRRQKRASEVDEN
jgi:hypothetical protein